jgi:ubiquitin-conjugating enzyme E2 H
MALIRAGFDVKMGHSSQEVLVLFEGPANSPYSGGMWRVRVYLPQEYPFKSPSISFVNPMYHPNVEMASGSVCLNVINQTWTPLYELRNVFQIFLPQLLLEPNPYDPLNTEAALLMLQDSRKYEATVKRYVDRFATLEQLKAIEMMDREEEDEVEEEEDGNRAAAAGGDGDQATGSLSGVETRVGNREEGGGDGREVGPRDDGHDDEDGHDTDPLSELSEDDER